MSTTTSSEIAQVSAGAGTMTVPASSAEKASDFAAKKAQLEKAKARKQMEMAKKAYKAETKSAVVSTAKKSTAVV